MEKCHPRGANPVFRVQSEPKIDSCDPLKQPHNHPGSVKTTQMWVSTLTVRKMLGPGTCLPPPPRGEKRGVDSGGPLYDLLVLKLLAPHFHLLV